MSGRTSNGVAELPPVAFGGDDEAAAVRTAPIPPGMAVVGPVRLDDAGIRPGFRAALDRLADRAELYLAAEFARKKAKRQARAESGGRPHEVGGKDHPHAGVGPAGNCGTGAGGFKPGNKCGMRKGRHGTGRGGTKAQRKKLADKIRALRRAAKTPEEHAALRAQVHAIRQHRLGAAGAPGSKEAAKLRRGIHAGKLSKTVVVPERVKKGKPEPKLGSKPKKAGTKPAKGDSVADLHRDYVSLREGLAGTTLPAARARLEALTAGRSKAEMAGLVTKLGYSRPATKAEAVGRLREIIERQKANLEQSRHIAGGGRRS